MSHKDFLQKIGILLLVIGWLALMYVARDVLISLLWAFVAIMLTSPLLTGMEKYKIPKYIAPVFVLLGVLIVFAVFIVGIAPVFVDAFKEIQLYVWVFLDFSRAAIADPTLLSKYFSGGILWKLGFTGELSSLTTFILSHLGSIASTVWEMTKNAAGGLFSWFLWVFNSIQGIGLTIIFYIFAAPQRDNLFSTVIRFFGKEYVPTANQTQSIEHVLSKWWKGQGMMALAMFAVTLVVLAILQFAWVSVTHIWSLAFIAGLCTFVPIIGPIIAAVPAILSAASGGILDMTVILLAYIFIQQIEGFVLIPRIHGSNLKLTDFEVIFWMTLAGSLFGIPGVLVTLPILASLKAVFISVPSKPSKTTRAKPRLKS